MSDQSINLNPVQVRALLDGRVSQARQVLELPSKQFEHLAMGGWEPCVNGGGGCFHINRAGKRGPVPETIGIWHRTTGWCQDAPYQVGDRLYVLEKWACRGRGDCGTEIEYAADGARIEHPARYFDAVRHLSAPGRWRSSTRMPRWASRLTLIVTEVRVERINAISSADAIAEGVQGLRTPDHNDFGSPGLINAQHPDRAFWLLWDHINGEGFWLANPWAAAISFRVHRANIDTLPTAPTSADPAPARDGVGR